MRGQKLTTEEWVSNVRSLYPENESLYDYSRVDYQSSKTLVIIGCRRCNSWFKIRPYSHLSHGRGCQVCGYRRMGKKSRLTTEEWVSRVLERYPYFKELYNYTESQYLGSDDTITIECRKCGRKFETTPQRHYSRRRGCTYCGLTKGELKIVDWLLSKMDRFEIHKKFKELPDHEFDVWLPEIFLIIEYDGEWHDQVIIDEEGLINRQIKDDEKDQWCADNFINLLRIHYTEDIVETLELEVTPFLI